MNRQVLIRRAGGLDQIDMVDAVEPVAAAGEAKVRVLAAGAAYGDVLLRSGLAGGGFPVTPGYDFVGVVEALGPGTTRVKVGDLVAALPGTGGQQRFICLSDDELVAVPSDLTAESAAGIVLNYTTAYQLLTRVARLKSGDVAFIYGLAGGLGTAMRQVAAELGIEVYGTASRDRLRTLQQEGATVFDRDDSHLIASVLAERPGGIDAVFDPVGGASLNRSYRLLGPKGTLVLLGAASVVQGSGNKMLKLATTLGRFLALKLRPGARRVTLFTITQAKTAHPEQFRDDLATLLGWLKEGKLDPLIRTMPLEDARHAQELLEGSHVTGKLVLIP